MPDPDVAAFVRASLPPAPARVLEVGAGRGELAELLVGAGYEVVAIDPAFASPVVRQVALADLDEPEGSFDAAIAVVSLHHVEPLAASCERLGGLVRAGGRLVIDEFDVERFDEGAARWWLGHREGHDEHSAPAETVAELRGHLHSVALLREQLSHWFELGDPVRGPYLYRWDLRPEMRPVEVEQIAAGELPAVGARLVGTRR